MVRLTNRFLIASSRARIYLSDFLHYLFKHYKTEYRENECTLQKPCLLRDYCADK